MSETIPSLIFTRKNFQAENPRSREKQFSRKNRRQVQKKILPYRNRGQDFSDDGNQSEFFALLTFGDCSRVPEHPHHRAPRHRDAESAN